MLTLRPVDEWHEDYGPVIWYHLPICEAPYIGSGPGSGECDRYGDPTPCAMQIESGWLTHWSPLPPCDALRTSDGVEVTEP